MTKGCVEQLSNRAGLEKGNVGADPPGPRGRPTTVREDKRQEHRTVPTGVMVSTRAEDGKWYNTGSPAQQCARANRNPVRGRPGWQGGGQVRSTEDAGVCRPAKGA